MNEQQLKWYETIYLHDYHKSTLYLRYNKDDILEYFSYMDKNISALSSLSVESNKVSSPVYVWNIDYNKHQEEPKQVSIISSYITKEHIEKLVDNVRKLENIKYTTNNDRVIYNGNNTFTYKVICKDRQIDLTFDNKYALAVYINSKSTTIKVLNTLTSEFEETHYIDDNLYHIINHIDNTETLYMRDQEIKYKFEKKDLSISKYLQFHQPIIATNYTTKQQFIMEYDEDYIMKSMIEISDPENNLCVYNKDKLFNDGAYKVTSIHPNIYDTFDKQRIDVFPLDSIIRATETYKNLFPVQSSSYIKEIIKLDEK